MRRQQSLIADDTTQCSLYSIHCCGMRPLRWMALMWQIKQVLHSLLTALDVFFDDWYFRPRHFCCDLCQAFPHTEICILSPTWFASTNDKPRHRRHWSVMTFDTRGPGRLSHFSTFVTVRKLSEKPEVDRLVKGRRLPVSFHSWLRISSAMNGIFNAANIVVFRHFSEKSTSSTGR